jgi:uncharacterized protein YecE (DUF72 family)
MYYSDYSPAAIADLAERLKSHPAAAEAWCIFDNTTMGYATGNALALHGRLAGA